MRTRRVHIGEIELAVLEAGPSVADGGRPLLLVHGCPAAKEDFAAHLETQDIASYTNAAGFVRRDTLVSFNLQVEQPFGKYLVVGARYSIAADITNFVVEYANGFVDPGGFVRHFAMGFVAVRY